MGGGGRIEIHHRQTAESSRKTEDIKGIQLKKKERNDTLHAEEKDIEKIQKLWKSEDNRVIDNCGLYIILKNYLSTQNLIPNKNIPKMNGK